MEKLDIIYDLVKDINKKQDSQSEILTELQKNVEINTKDLTIHREGVIGNRKRIALLEKQFEQSQTPQKTVKNFGKFIVWLGGLSAAVFFIYRLLHTFNLV